MKRNLLFLLFYVLLPLTASAYDVCIDGIYYNVVKKAKQATVTSGDNKYSGSVEIPATIDYDGVTYNVVAIGDQAFENCSGLTSVTIPNSVNSIGQKAFNDCNGLTSVHISDIAAWCNISFSSLYSIYVTGTSISNPLFYAHHLYINGQEIKKLVIPNSVTSIGNYAFSGCSGLTSVTIPNSVTSIGNYAFEKCDGLTSITIPSSVTTMGNCAFQYCSILPSVTIPNNVTSIGKKTFYGCSGLTSVIIGNSVTSIDESAFYECSGLTSITIPNSVTSIGESAFYGCSGLTSITIPNSVTSINGSTFRYCSGLNSVTIPNSVTSIGNYAFYGCSGLTSVTIPNSVTTIGTQVFYNCSSLAIIIIGNGILKITAKAFANCEELTDVYCYAEAVPSTSSDVFANSLIEYATLHVPSASIDLYSAANVWKDFNNIVALQNGDPGNIAQGVTINETNFPDAVFREYVSGSTIDKDQNGKLSDEEISAVKTIDVNNLEISDLAGIEFFTALTTLNCRFTKITSIDLSRNTALKNLDCRNNTLTALNVANNTALTALRCSRNKITSLDVSKNTKLSMLRCNYNQLTALDVSKCTQLQRLDCFGNKIGKTAMDNLIASLPSTTNGAFYVIDTTLDSEENVCTTDQVAAAKAKGWTVYDYNNNSPVEYAGSTEQELGDLNGDNAVNGTDLVQQTNLILAGQYNAVADMNHDGVVNGTDYVLMVNKILGVSSAPMMMAPASASAGDATLNIEDFTISTGETKEMLIDMNNPSDEITLIQFDLRLPDGLSIATEGGEMLIDIAGRTTWRKHSLNANTLGDVTRFLLSSPTNAVISGTSGAVISITLTASDNFNGGTIQLENQLLVTPSADETKPADYSFTIEGNVPQGISIDEANFPDQKFREYVSGASIDKNQDRRLSDEELAEVTTIDVSNQAISSLKGVEFFTSLTTLKCGKNNLKMLDVSKNTAISYLYCDNNPLSSLDVTNNVALELLSCFNNQLTSLDVSKNAALKYLYCDDNSLKSLDVTKNAALSILSCDDCQLSSLDLSNNPALTALSCNKNLFTSLDVSKNTALTTLYCYINSLTALDVSNNTSLSELYCDNNQLTTLDLSKNTALTTFTCFNNMISESEMDQLVNSLPTVSNGKAYMICTRSHTEENVVNTDQVALAKSKGWTVFDYNGTSSEEYEGSATTGISGIDWDASGKNVPIHTLSGQRLTTPKKGINIIGGKKVVVK